VVEIFPEFSPRRHKGHKEERAPGRAYGAQSKAAGTRQDFSSYGELMRSAGLPLTIGYTGHLWDRALGQYAAPFRYYTPANARWNMRDPLGFVDGPNVYAYVAGNPVMLRDALGFCGDDKGNRKSQLDRNIPDYTDGADPRTGEPPRPRMPDYPNHGDLDDILKTLGRRVPDGPKAPGRNKATWKWGRGEIVYENHNYVDVSDKMPANHPHRKPHYHYNVPEKGKKPEIHIDLYPGNGLPKEEC
jgi:RHS repeat-associated protein